ncbi:MAG: ABC transporter ATP-binding protein [Firmicutes bacterium]|nr:ABC transporter ATP-binding protein [Bacillota bacterium]MCL5038380.1 ABC transporter ATP-binding protein [Bacillota bacterium]
MAGITKRFPGVLANDDVTIEVQAGEVLALLGENGAGKTTLMNVLYGLYQPDSGEIRINKKPVHITSPRQAIELGIGMVHQHFMLVPTLTVAENVALGLVTSAPVLDLKVVSKKITEISSSYGLAVNPEAYVWQLSVGEQQRVEIVKAIFLGASLLVLDEPTAVLTPQEAAELLNLLKRMAEQGRPIVFISHKLNEVMAVSQRVTVLRDGRVVASVKTEDTSAQELARLMVGREMTPRRREGEARPGRTVLELRNVQAANDKGSLALRGISLEVRASEVLGIAGVSGNGQRELAEAISGLRKVTDGQVFIGEREVTNRTPDKMIASGLGYIPEDRLHVGTISSFAVWENLVLKDHHRRPYARSIFLQNGPIRSATASLVGSYGVKTPTLDTPTGRLSGGNIQRLILAREISRSPSVLLAAYPSRGLDVGATEYVHTKLLEARKTGTGVLLISEDLEEILNLSDRVAVLYEGKIMKTLPVSEANERILGLLMAGVA